MRPETRAFLARAHRDLSHSKAIATLGLVSVTTRCAYYAAEALICEQTGKTPKTHAGVHSEFARLVKDRRDIGRPLQAFLTRAYKYKQHSDYGPTESEEPPNETGVEAIAMATEFVARVEALLTTT